MADALKPDELAINSNSFAQKTTNKGVESIDHATLPLLEIPTINIGILNSSLSSEVEVELRKLRSALSSSGYFQAINHGMNTSFLDEVLEVTRSFFHLPLEDKQKCPRVANEYEGYVCNTQKDYQTIGWNERLYLHVPPQSISNFQKWPQKLENFRRVLLEYTEKLKVLNEIILKAMAKSLKLDENCFLHQFGGNPRLLSTFNFYPPCPWPDVLDANKPHSDPSGITFILQDDEVEGLQVLKKNQWHRTPLTPDAIAVNIGDQVEIMSNGIFKSPIHRVPTNSKRERISLAFFFCPELSSGGIKPAEGLIDEKNPRMYKNVIDYLRHFRENIQHGITRPLDALKI